MIVSIEFVESVDNSPRDSIYDYDEYPQGTTWTNYDIYRLVHDDDTPDQFMKIGKVYNSYGSQDGSTRPELTKPEAVQKTVWR
jgi:hypothetical protein